MDISLLRHRTHQFKNLLSRVASSEKNNHYSKANPEILKVGRGIALLLIAILLAWMSKNEIETRTRDQILQYEWPSPPVWTGVLKQGGWSRLEKPDLSAILKHHPDPFSNQSVIWESDDHCLIFLTSSPYQKDQQNAELWSCASSQNIPKKLKWHKIGSGYSGVNLLSQIIQVKPKKTLSYIDPKEIRY